MQVYKFGQVDTSDVLIWNESFNPEEEKDGRNF